jgi:hypothetical protein
MGPKFYLLVTATTTKPQIGEFTMWGLLWGPSINFGICR